MRIALLAMAILVAHEGGFTAAFQVAPLSGPSHLGSGHNLLGSHVCPVLPSSPRIAALQMSSDGDIDMSAFFKEVDHREDSGGEPMDGAELRGLVMQKWKYPLDTRIHRRRDAFGKQTVWLQVMWKHLWEQSFPLTEEEYDAQLDAVAWYITEWGKADYVRD
mmetsp:Transcript_52666/g.105511  ORF Transcript_52666/g.105511 Transcript_52666/m.105511 type:complete len:162 (-) Transcript_52666:175-660(-)